MKKNGEILFYEEIWQDKVEGNRTDIKSGFKAWQDKNYNEDNQPVVCVSQVDVKAYSE